MAPDYHPIEDGVEFRAPVPEYWQGMIPMSDHDFFTILSHGARFTPEEIRNSGWVYAGATWDRTAFDIVFATFVRDQVDADQVDMTDLVGDRELCPCDCNISAERCGFILHPLKRQVLPLCQECTEQFQICHCCLASSKCMWRCSECIRLDGHVHARLYSAESDISEALTRMARLRLTYPAERIECE